MNITKDILTEIDHIEFVLENCDGYSINPEDILDVWFDEIQFGAASYNENIVHDGRILLSKNIFKQLGDFAYCEYEDGTTALNHDPEEHFYFYNRIMACCDITQVHFYYKNGKKLWLFVDYDPIENEMSGCEVEYSNCPSAELDDNGDMLISFGKSSHAFKRVDNDYYNVIDGLKEFLPQALKGILNVKFESFGNVESGWWSSENGLFNDLFVEIRIQNKEYKNKYLPLQFSNVSKLIFILDFKNDSGEDLWISPAMDGKLFVQFGGRCNFYCKSIKVFKDF